jgi:hypothetical protein
MELSVEFLSDNPTEKTILITVMSDVNGAPCKKNTQVRNFVVEKAARNRANVLVTVVVKDATLPMEIIKEIARDLVTGALQLPPDGRIWLAQAVAAG